MERITRRIGDIVELIDGKGYASLSRAETDRLIINTLAECEDVLEGRKNKIMSAVFKKQDWLYQQKDMSVELKSAMMWGALSVAHNTGEIDWDSMRNMYGEFMSHLMRVR